MTFKLYGYVYIKFKRMCFGFFYIRGTFFDIFDTIIDYQLVMFLFST